MKCIGTTTFPKKGKEGKVNQKLPDELMEYVLRFEQHRNNITSARHSTRVSVPENNNTNVKEDIGKRSY